MNYFEEEEDEIKQVISHKKNEFRVEIRKKKMQQDFQTKRLKIIQNCYQDQLGDSGFENNEDGQNQSGQQQMNSQVQNIFNNNQDQNEDDYSYLNETPDLLHFEEKLNILMTQLSEGFKMKDMLLCQDLMRILERWTFEYAQYKEILEIKQILNLMIISNVHLFCTSFASQKYLQFYELQFASYYILAQISSIINRAQLNEMVNRHIFNHFIEGVMHSESPKILDNVILHCFWLLTQLINISIFYYLYNKIFHTMGNLAGDNDFGAFFCSELVDRDIMAGAIQVFELCQEDQIQQFLDSYLFFLHHFIKYVPEIQREHVFQFLPILFLLLKSFKKVQVKRYCLKCIKLIVTYDVTKISDFDEEDYFTLGSIIYENPQLMSDALNLINFIIQESDSDKVITKLIENEILISLVKVLESSKDPFRERAAFILSNISSVPDQYIQNELLVDSIYKPIMKSLVDDIYAVRKNLAYYLVNLISSATAETMSILIESKSVIHFFSMVFQQFDQDMEFISQALSSFWQLFQKISIFTENKIFIKHFTQIQEIGIIDKIESLMYHQNREIAEKAEGIFNQLQQNDIIKQNDSDTNSSDLPTSFQYSRNLIAGSQIPHFTQPNLFTKELQNEYQQSFNSYQNVNNNINNNNNLLQNDIQNNINQQQFSNSTQNNCFKNQMMQE